MKNRTTYTPADKLQIIRDVLSHKTSIQKVSKEKGIAPTLISLWKKQADDAMLARFHPQPKGRRKSIAPSISDSADIRALRNEARKARIKAAHIETSLKETKAQAAQLEEHVRALAAVLGYKLVKNRNSRKTHKN